MNLKAVSETLSATTIGASFGIWMYQCNAQGTGNGTQTLVRIKPEGTENVHHGTRSEFFAIIPWIIAALVTFAIFKMLAAGIYGLLSSIFAKEKTIQL